MPTTSVKSATTTKETKKSTKTKPTVLSGGLEGLSQVSVPQASEETKVENVKQEETAKPVASTISAEISSPVEEAVKTSSSDTGSDHSDKQHVRKPFVVSKKPHGPRKSHHVVVPGEDEYPQHLVQIALILKNNSEMRRFTSLNILNYLGQKGEISIPAGASKYVDFKWDKFTVKVNNIQRDYEYKEVFFINALASAFTSFANSAQIVINNLVKVEQVQFHS